MAEIEISIDGVNIATTLGFTLTKLDNRRGGPNLRFGSDQTAGRVRRVITAPKFPSVNLRKYSIEGIMDAATPSALQGNMDELVWRLQQDEIELTFSDISGRSFFGFLSDWDTGADFVPKVHSRFNFSLSLEVPYMQDSTQQDVSFTTVAVDMPQGTGVAYPLIRITGAFTNPTLTYKDNTGATVGTALVFTLTKAGGEFVEIDSLAETILDDLGADQEGAVVGDFPIMDGIRNANFPTSAWPTLEVTSGSGNSKYRRVWATG